MRDKRINILHEIGRISSRDAARIRLRRTDQVTVCNPDR